MENVANQSAPTPKETWEVVSPFGFDTAIRAIKAGLKVCRQGWNGKGMFIAYIPGAEALPADRFWSGQNSAYAEAQGGTATVLPCITMKTATGEILMGWLASQTDMLATDWEVLE